MVKERLVDVFKEIGFDEYKEITMEDIIFSQDVFNQCARNTCGNFGKYHTCKGGTVAESQERVSKFEHGFLISKIVPIGRRKEMMESLELVSRVINDLRKALKDENVMILGAGPCTLCETCTQIEGKPCRFPDKTQYSMEGSGIDVVRMSMNTKMTYNAGAGKIGYFTMVLF